MVGVWTEGFPISKYKKLQYWSVGPYEFKKINSKAYILDQPDNIGISNIFKMEDLSRYWGSINAASENVAAARLPPASNVRNEIEDIVDTNTVSAQGGG